MPIEFVQNGALQFDLQAADDGDLLVFRNAILARHETNANNDHIPADEVANLAASIGGRAVDVEHDKVRNCGVFTAGRVVEEDGHPALSVDGFIWRDRYPTEAEGVMRGTHKLSVEASAERAECSVCQGVFQASDNYCEHLLARRRYNAVRTVRGLRAKGGAVTRNPAGSRTVFDRQQLYLVASHADPNAQEDSMVKCPHCQADVEASDNCSKCQKAISPALLAQQLAEMESKWNEATQANSGLVAEKESLTASLNAAKEAETAALAAKTAAEAAAETAKAEAQAAREAQRQTALGLDATEWAKQKDAVMSMNDAAFSLFASVAPRKPNLQGFTMPNGQTGTADGAKPKITL